MAFYDVLQVLDYLHDRIDSNKTALGLRYIAYGDEQLLPQYPAAVVTAERPMSRELHATRQFKVVFNCDIYVLHARLSASHKVRTKEDIELAQGVRKFLHTDYTLGSNIIFGFVQIETPGIITRVVGQKSAMVVSTRLAWTGTSVARFEDS